MPLITLTHARLAFGHHPLLDDAEFQLDPRERIGLIGRNGSGKTSLLQVLAGRAELDSGEAWVAPRTRIACVVQEPAFPSGLSIFDAVAEGLGPEGRLLADYHHALDELATDAGNAARMARVAALQSQLDHSNGWALSHRVDTVLSRLALPADGHVDALSGGWRKRVALAQALAGSPDVLLLDEPTNHLDMAAIEWLEQLLVEFAGAVVCITHDRRFLDTVATRIVELDRGHLLSYPGTFVAYQQRKARQLEDEAVVNAKADKVLAQEEAWIRQGVEARRTRNEGRVLRLEALRRERAARRDRLGRVNLDIAAGERSGQLVAALEHVSKDYGRGALIRDFSTRVMRGDRIGLVGPNGAGKSTLLKLILGEIEPDQGAVRRGTHIHVAYFDQLRAQLDPDATLIDTINPGAEFVEIGGRRTHVITYLGDFLFAPERARSPVASLSGGERNRLLLARLFARPANVLVLDEPTNDLDIDTLELLEALLQDYRGTLFLVSHDRAFLDNVITQTIAFEGDGILREHAGGFSDWEDYHARQDASAPKASRRDEALRPPATPGKSGTRKLSFNEHRELADLPAQIQALEMEAAERRARFADPTIYRGGAVALKAMQDDLVACEVALAEKYERWEALETRLGALAPAKQTQGPYAGS
jgi:ABC transport system ATP-binding/permease protein